MPWKEAECVLYWDRKALSLHFFISLLRLFSTDLKFLPFRKNCHLKKSRWKEEESLGASSSHSSGNTPCFSVPHFSEPCLCGCSLRTKAVLHPRPLPVSRPASQVLPHLSSGKKQLSPPVIVFRAQPSQSFPKPKAKAMSQLLPWVKSSTSFNAMSLRKLAPMGVWPQGFLDPLSKSLPEESLHPYIPLGESHFPSQGTISPMTSLVERDKPQSSLPFLFK